VLLPGLFGEKGFMFLLAKFNRQCFYCVNFLLKVTLKYYFDAIEQKYET